MSKVNIRKNEAGILKQDEKSTCKWLIINILYAFYNRYGQFWEKVMSKVNSSSKVVDKGRFMCFSQEKFPNNWKSPLLAGLGGPFRRAFLCQRSIAENKIWHGQSRKSSRSEMTWGCFHQDQALCRFSQTVNLPPHLCFPPFLKYYSTTAQVKTSLGSAPN